MEYFILNGTETHGPFSEEELRTGIASGQLTEHDLVRTGEDRLWTRLGKVVEELDGPPKDPTQKAANAPFALPAGGDRTSVAQRWTGNRVALVRRVEEEPLPIGIAAVVIACVFALLVRWPILLVLPGIAVGVACGLVLIMRNRPIVGGLLSLAALLLPLAFLPSPRTEPPAAESARVDPVAQTAPTPVAPAPILADLAPRTPSAPTPEPLAPLAPPDDAAPLAPAASAPSALVVPEPAAPLAPAPSPLAPASSPLAPAPPAVAPLPAQPEDAVYVIETSKGRGAGFIAGIGDRVYFFTSHRVLEGAEKVNVRGGVQPPQNLGQIIEIAADRDLVRVPLPERAALRFASSGKAGDAVTAFAESGAAATRIQGTVLASGSLQLQLSSALPAGSSGGPLLDVNDEVLGVATFAPKIENLATWMKTGTRPADPRRWGVRVPAELRWERMLMSAYQANSARLAEIEAILGELVGFAHQLAHKPFRSEISTRFLQRPDLRGWVEAYNGNARTRMVPNAGRMRDYAQRLMRTVSATQTALQDDVRSPRLAPSKGYLKQREDELLRAFNVVHDEIAKVFEVQS